MSGGLNFGVVPEYTEAIEVGPVDTGWGERSLASAPMRERRRILVEGTVQGVGFRPFVYGLALKHALSGFILNDTTGVIIEVEGEPSALESFLYALRTDAPPLATIEGISWEALPSKGYGAFTIEKSQADEDRRVLISPDTCTCDDCLRELFDPQDRRYRHPFINCTNCGPRFTIIKDTPYDRERTTMGVFPMCPDCRREYEDPLNRRFHAQPNACPSCGPRVMLVDQGGARSRAKTQSLTRPNCYGKGTS
jgi:hydrogenase maturation protein HypF